jgi:hypothetical protein
MAGTSQSIKSCKGQDWLWRLHVRLQGDSHYRRLHFCKDCIKGLQLRYCDGTTIFKVSFESDFPIAAVIVPALELLLIARLASRSC